jgi:hypothetical protein
MSQPGEVPHWVPSSEADVAEAMRQGLLEEGHHLDLKREIPPGRGANKELAVTWRPSPSTEGPYSSGSGRMKGETRFISRPSRWLGSRRESRW